MRLALQGSNNYGQLGDNTTSTSSASPVQVAGGYSWAQIAAGMDHTCGLLYSGKAYCWGGWVGGWHACMQLCLPACLFGGHASCLLGGSLASD